MELLEGQTLGQLMNRQPSSIEKLLPMTIQIADALESAHAKGIVHRDIKPANLFVKDRGQVKVLDFGLAKIEGTEILPAGSSPSKLDTMVEGELTSPGATVGTISYMSPEQARGQLVDARTDLFSLGTVLYQLASGVLPFKVQDEIARKIAEALRVTLSPQELEALAIKPTENLQAYDLYLRGKRYARRQTRQDLEFALQMFENAVAMDPSFALAYAACANACAMFYCNYSREAIWVERARNASGKAPALRWDLPEVQVSQAWVLYATALHDESVRMVLKAIERKKDCEGAYYLLCRALFSAGRYQEVVDVMDQALEVSGEDYNVYVPIANALGALGKKDDYRNLLLRRIVALENHLKQVPEDARARILLSADYAELDRVEDSLKELHLAITLRANEASILYNAACTYALLKRKAEALDTLRMAWEAGFKDSTWIRRDPDLAMLLDEPEFDRLYPAAEASGNGKPANT